MQHATGFLSLKQNVLKPITVFAFVYGFAFTLISAWSDFAFVSAFESVHIEAPQCTASSSNLLSHSH